MVTRDTILFTESLNDNRTTREARKISAQAVCTKVPGEGPRNQASPESTGGGSKKVQEPEQFEDRQFSGAPNGHRESPRETAAQQEWEKQVLNEQLFYFILYNESVTKKIFDVFNRVHWDSFSICYHG
jgi:hypothetical protein